MRPALVVGVLFLAAAPVAQGAQASGNISISYGPEATVFGSCQPKLTLVNGTKDPLDYVEIDVLYTLHGGRDEMREHRSRYRYGLSNPIEPGQTRLLAIHADESMPLFAKCTDIDSVRIDDVVCLTASTPAKDCRDQVKPEPGRELALPVRH